MVRCWALALPYRAKAQQRTFLYMTIFMTTYLLSSKILINFFGIAESRYDLKIFLCVLCAFARFYHPLIIFRRKTKALKSYSLVDFLYSVEIIQSSRIFIQNTNLNSLSNYFRKYLFSERVLLFWNETDCK